MEIVTFIYESHHFHYEELRLRYHQRSPFVNPFFTKRNIKKNKELITGLILTFDSLSDVLKNF